MSAINRWNRGLQVDRAGELLETDSTPLQPEPELPPIEAIPRLQNRFQEELEALQERFRDGFDAVARQAPVELGAINRLLTSEDFQARLRETLEGTSERAQQVKEIESVYQAFWQDSEDFTVAAAASPAHTSPELPRYEAPAETAWKGRAMTVPEFQAVGDVAEPESVQQATEASAALRELLLTADEVEQPFSARGRTAVRA